MSVSFNRHPTRLCLAVAAGLLAAAALGAARTSPAVERLLTQTLGFSGEDLHALDSGSAVIRSLDTPAREEIANVGAVYIDAMPERFLEQFKDIVQFEKGPGIPQIGVFSSPPRLADLASLTLPPSDLSALRSCRAGDCDLKLTAAAMSRFREEVNWSSPDAAAQATAIMRDMILELVLAYQRDGNAALGAYQDRSKPLSVADEFLALLASDTPLPTPVPDLMRYLGEYPRGRRPAGLEDFFYWTVVDFGLKHTIRVNHVMIYPVASGPASPVSYAIAIKQLYASHYFFTTLELRFLINRDGQAGDNGIALVSITRSRNDGMTGFKGLFLGPIIRRRSRDAVRVYLEHIRQQLEPLPGG
jgi:hypothetical protein